MKSNSSPIHIVSEVTFTTDIYHYRTVVICNTIYVSILINTKKLYCSFFITGYVKFEKEEEALSALARDRVPYNGRPVFISELKPERGERKPAFKYSTSTENNKLFVKGLPPDKTKEDVGELFKRFSPKDVRLVVKKSGLNKGRL